MKTLKRLFFALIGFCALSPLSSVAQIRVPAFGETYKYNRFVTEAQYKDFKNRTLVYLYTNYDNDAELYKTALQKVWPNGKVEMIAFKDRKEWEEKNDVAFVGYSSRSMPDGSTDISKPNQTNWGMWTCQPGRMGTKEKVMFGEFIVSSNMDLEFEGDYPYMYTTTAQTKAFVNCGPAFLATYVKIALKALENKTPMAFLDEIKDKAALKPLKTTPLYVSKDDLVEPGFMGTATKTLEPAKFFKNYPYVYKAMSAEEINAAMTDSKESLFFMTMNKTDNNVYYLSFYDYTNAKVVFQSRVTGFSEICKYLKKEAATDK